MTTYSGRRSVFARLANLLIPGSGLILARREWSGLLLALLYGLFAQAALAGHFLAPAGIPRWLTIAATIAAALVWIAAQIVLARRIRWLKSPEARSQFDALVNESREAAARNDLETARASLAGALDIDDEHLDANAEFARLLMRMNPRAARKIWRRVAALDRNHRFADELKAFQPHR